MSDDIVGGELEADVQTDESPESVDPEVLRPNRIGRLEVTPVGDVPVTFNMMIYGDPGVGKTVLAGSAAEIEEMGPVLFVDMEGGTLSLVEKFPSVDLVRVKDMAEMQEVYNALKKGDSGYNTVVIDSLSELQNFAMHDIMVGVVDEDPDRDPDVPSLREYMKNLTQMRRFVRAFRDLSLNTIFTALANEDKDQKTGKITTKPGLTGKAANEVAGFLDLVLYMYVKEVDEELTRLLLTEKTDRIIAKDRTGRLPSIMQDVTMRDIYEVAFTKPNNKKEDLNGSA